MKKTDRRVKVLLFAFVAVIFSMAGAFAADEAVVEDPEVLLIKKLARRVVEEFDKPYSIVALGISSAVLPDEADYFLHEPMDIDISFPLDTFKRHYCETVPAGSTMEITGVDSVKISDWKRTVKRSGVYIDYPKLEEAVSGVVSNFRKSTGDNKYDYTVDITRSASARVIVKHKKGKKEDGSPSACNPDAESRIYVSFVEQMGRWRLYDISRSGLPECRDSLGALDPPGKESTPFYTDCAVPEKLKSDESGENSDRE